MLDGYFEVGDQFIDAVSLDSCRNEVVVVDLCAMSLALVDAHFSFVWREVLLDGRGGGIELMYICVGLTGLEILMSCLSTGRSPVGDEFLQTEWLLVG